MKKPFVFILIALLFLSKVTFSQSEAEVLKQLFYGASNIVDQAEELISLSVDAVWYASDVTGVKTTSGTLTQSSSNYDNWNYSFSPNDKLVLIYANGDIISFVFYSIDGYVDGDEYDFKRSHVMDFLSVSGESMNLRIQSETGPEDGKIYWNRTITGITSLDAVSYNINLTSAGNNNEEIENGFAFGDYYDETSGTVSSGELLYGVDENYYTRIGHNSNAGIYVQSRQLKNNNSVSGNNFSYRYENANCFWVGGTKFYDDANRGIFNEVIEDYNWFAQGSLYKNGNLYGSITFDRPIVNYSGGAYIIANCANGSNYYLMPALLPGAISSSKNIESNSLNMQCYPNPASNNVTLSYSIKEVSNVRIEMLDISGRMVKVFDLKMQKPGDYTVNINTEGIISGTYIYRLSTSSHTISKKIFKQ